MAGTLDIVALDPDGTQRPGTMPASADRARAGPLVSCLMVTTGDRASARLAIECYRRQTYPRRELVVVSVNDVSPLLAAAADPSIRSVRAVPASLGALRNLAVAHAAGELLCVWDDDDLSDPRRIDLLLAALAAADAAAAFVMRPTLWWPQRRRLAVASRRAWEPTMLARRDVVPPYPDTSVDEDAIMLAALRARERMVVVDAPAAYCYVAHGRNTVGAAHFERLFANATRQVGDGAYDAVLARLARALPVADYAALLSPEPA